MCLLSSNNRDFLQFMSCLFANLYFFLAKLPNMYYKNLYYSFEPFGGGHRGFLSPAFLNWPEVGKISEFTNTKDKNTYQEVAK